MIRRFRYFVELDFDDGDDRDQAMVRPIEIREGIRTFLERAYSDISDIHVYIAMPIGYEDD